MSLGSPILPFLSYTPAALHSCPRHEDRTSCWSCAFCKEDLCDDCVEPRNFRGEEIHVCKECGGKVGRRSSSRPKVAPASFETHTADRRGSLPEHVADPKSSSVNCEGTQALRHEPQCTESRIPVSSSGVNSPGEGPTRGSQNLLQVIDLPFLWSGEGVLLLPMLAMASLALAIAPEFLGWLPIAGWFYLIVQLMVWSWVLGIGMEIIRGALGGEDRLSFQDNLASGDGLWQRQAPWATLCLIGYGPLIVYLLFGADDGVEIPLLLGLLFWRDLYITLAMPSFTWFGSWASILPLTCLRDMIRLGGPFLTLLVACFGLSLLSHALVFLISLWSGPVLLQAQAQFLFFLAFLLKMRWIGVFYRRYLPKIGW